MYEIYAPEDDADLQSAWDLMWSAERSPDGHWQGDSSPDIMSLVD